MQRTVRLAHSARRRDLERSLVMRLGTWLPIGSGVGLALVLAQRAGILPVNPYTLAALPLLGSAAIAACLAMRRRPSLLAAASLVDTSLHLKDRLSTAVALGPTLRGISSQPADPFITLAIEDAEQTAPRADVRRAIPLRFDWTWGLWPALTAGAITAAIFLPRWDLFGSRAAESIIAAESARRDQAAAEIGTASELARKDPTLTSDPAAAAKLAELDQIEAELKAGASRDKPAADAARAAGARTLEQLASAAENRATDQRRELNATNDRVARALAEQPADSALAKALREGDYSRAAEAARSLADPGAMTPQEREEIARQLDSLGDALGGAEPPPSPQATSDHSQPAPAPPESPTQPENPPKASPENSPQPNPPPQNAGAKDMDPALREALQRQGLTDEQARSLPATDPEKTKQELEKKGVDPATAEKLSQRLAEDAADRKAADQARKNTQDLARAMKQEADRLRNEDRSGAEKPPEPRAQENPQDSNTAPGKPDQQNPGAPNPTSTDRQSPRPGEPRDQQPGAKPTDAAQKTPTDNSGSPDKSKPAESGPAKPSPDAPKGQDRGAGERGGKPETTPPGAPKSNPTDTAPKGENATPTTKPSPTDKPQQPEPKAGDKNPAGDSTPGASTKQDQPAGTKPDQPSKPDQPGTVKPTDGAPTSQQQGDKPTPGTQPAPNQPAPSVTPPGKAPSAVEPKPSPGGAPKPERADHAGAPQPKGNTPGSAPKDRQPSQSDKPEPGANPGEAPAPGDKSDPSGKTPKSAPGAPEIHDAFGQGDKPATQAKPGDTPKPGETPSTTPPDQPSQADRSLADKLRDLQALEEQARQHQRTADELHQRAREIAEQASPEERRRLQRWNEELARERGLPNPSDDSSPNIPGDRAAHDNRAAAPTDPLDMKTLPPAPRPSATNSAPSDKSRVIGNIYSNQKPGPGHATSALVTEESLARARDSAQKAVEDRIVPGRYSKLLGRYFKQLPAPGAQPTPPETARDAEPDRK